MTGSQAPRRCKSANLEFVALVRRQLPRFYTGERWWALFTAASLVRMADTVESLMDLMSSKRDLDGQTLVRSLYEQVVTFAWIAIDPEKRQRRWAGEGRWDELKLHNDAATFGLPILTQDEVAATKKSLGMEPETGPEAPRALNCARGSRRKGPDPDRVLPPVTERAREADEYWSSRVAGLHPSGDPLGFRGLYLPAYRVASRATHSSMMALEPYLSREPNRLVIDDAEPGPRIMWALIGPLFGIALTIAAQHVNWIDEVTVREIVDRATWPGTRDRTRLTLIRHIDRSRCRPETRSRASAGTLRVASGPDGCEPQSARLASSRTASSRRRRRPTPSASRRPQSASARLAYRSHHASAGFPRPRASSAIGGPPRCGVSRRPRRRARR